MGNAYEMGLMVGTFVAGCACGLFPLIVAIIKKRAMIGAITMIVCGMLSFIQPFLSLVVAIAVGFVLCIMRKKS